MPKSGEYPRHQQPDAFRYETSETPDDVGGRKLVQHVALADTVLNGNTVTPNLIVPEKDPSVKRVAIGIPLKGHTAPEGYHDRMMMAFNLGIREMEMRISGVSPRYEFVWFTAGEIFVPFARDQLARMAIEHNCDYLFMVDDDMIAPPDLFFDLVKHDVDIVAPLAFTRNPPHHAVVYQTECGYSGVVHSEYFKTEFVKNYPKNQLFECDAVGFGAVLIKTEVLLGMQIPWFMSTSPTGEDILFCINAKKKGFKVWMDSSVKLGHLSHSIIVTEEYAERFQGLTPEQRERQFGFFRKYPTLERLR